MPLLALDQLCRHRTRADRCMPPFFGALDALTVDDGGGGACLSFRPFSTFDVECVMNAIQYAVALPPDEVVVDRAARWKILRKITPLATGAQDVHHAVHHRTHIGAPLAPAGLRRWNERVAMRPLVVRQTARVPKVISIVFRSVLMRPHRRRLPESGRLL